MAAVRLKQPLLIVGRTRALVGMNYIDVTAVQEMTYYNKPTPIIIFAKLKAYFVKTFVNKIFVKFAKNFLSQKLSALQYVDSCRLMERVL